MNLNDITHLSLNLKRDPQVATPMRDALEDLGMTWDDWLEKSGTLDRLAECMCSLSGFTRISGGPQRSWLNAMGIPQPDGAINHGESALWFCFVCRPFLVPPFVLDWSVSENYSVEPEHCSLVWGHAPERALAILVLKQARLSALRFPGLLNYPELPGAASWPRPPLPPTEASKICPLIKEFADLAELREAISELPRPLPQEVNRQPPVRITGYRIQLHPIAQERPMPARSVRASRAR